jgi:hypothetical protein
MTPELTLEVSKIVTVAEFGAPNAAVDSAPIMASEAYRAQWT